jgi:plastocyanin
MASTQAAGTVPKPMVEPLKDVSDGALVVAIGRWREDALAEAYRRHAGAVYALARRVTGDTVLAEEVVQEVYLRLWNSPDTLNVKSGTKVTFTNEDGFAHTVTAKDKAFDSGNLDQGDTFEHTFAEAGTFEYRCAIHNSMTGKVVVS